MRILLLALVFFNTFHVVGQSEKYYLVFTFNKIYEIDGYKHGTGDHVWIIPYDNCRETFCEDDLKPLFFDEYQIISLEDSITCNQTFGEFPIADYSKQDPIAWTLFKNRREIQQYVFRYSYPKSKGVLKIFCVPIIANCRSQIKGNFNVMTFETPPQVWTDFWRNQSSAEVRRVLHHNFSNFNYIVTLETKK